jgi:bile acid:Na+ symporter, BASS family
MYDKLVLMDEAQLNFSDGGLAALNIAIAFIMFGVALNITPQSLKNLVLKPKATIIGVISQFVLLPAVTFGLVMFLYTMNLITVGVGMGMILVASCPGGNVSNFISAYSNGNAALSVGLTAIATLGAIIMTPFNFTFYGGLFAANSNLLQPIQIDPVLMFKTVILLLGIPIAIGMGFAWKFPKMTSKIFKPIQNLSVVFFLGMVVMIFSNNFDHFLTYIGAIILVVFLHNFIALGTGYTAASIFKLNKRNRRTITIETGIQNSGLGLVLIFTSGLFDGIDVGGMAVITAWWGVWHIIAGLGIASIWKRIPYTDEK